MSEPGARPPSGRGRLPTSLGRPPSAASRGRGLTPGSSMGRPPGTGMRPGTRGGGGVDQGGALNAQIKVADRPMTRQGLTGMKTGGKGLGPHRQVMDKSYYMGQLRAKMTELSTEIAKMQKEVDQFSQENSAYVSYEKRAESLASEIKDLQGQLADYNTLVDKLNTDTEMGDIIEDYNTLKNQNEREQHNIDEIFTQKREKEQQIRQLEIELDQERRMAESLVEDMPADQRAKYAKLKTMNNALQSELEQKQQELDALTTRITNLEEEVSASPIKQEAVSLYERINELESKKQNLMDEMEKENKGSPAEERERLLKQVKEDNQEIASMERRITELKEKIDSINGDIQNLDMDLEEHQGERNQKYRELKKREETMQEFLDTFEETKAQELDRKQQLESGIIVILEHMSRGMARTKHMPTPGELKQMQDDLNFKEIEMQKSQSTAVSLASEHTRLQMDLDKVEQLEGKITSELDGLKQKIDNMTEELETYNDLDALKEKAEEKKKKLQGEKKALSLRREAFKKHVQRLSSLYDATKSKLLENETYSQLGNLERKWQHHEQNNFVMKEFIASKSMESDYRPIKQNVSAQLDELNKILIQNLGK